MTQPGPAGVVSSADATALLTGPLGAILLAGARETGRAVALVVHTLEPRALGSPVHTHSREDEWSFVLDGEVGIEIEGRPDVARSGDAILKPRGIPHAFWNAGDQPARLLEVITPGGFEGYFAELASVLTGDGPPDLAALARIAEDFGLELDLSSVPRLAAEHGLRV